MASRLSARARAKIYLSSAIAFIPTYFIIPSLVLQEWPQLFLGGAAYALIYLTMILMLKTLTIIDLQNLRRMFSSLGPLAPLFNFFLSVFDKYVK